MKRSERRRGPEVRSVLLSALVLSAACTTLSEQLTQRGIELAEGGDVAAGEAELRSAIEADSQNALAAYELGALAENRADDHAARNWYRRAATRAKDRRVEENDEDVPLSVWALRGLERVNRRIAADEGTVPEPIGPTAPAEPAP